MKKERIKLEIGQEVWMMDRNRRVYTDDKGNKTIGPWFKGYFVKNYVIGETTQSYIFGYSPYTKLDWGNRFKKSELKNGFNIYLTQKDVDNACWIHENVCEISDKLRRCKDYCKLTRILSILDEE